MSNVTSTDHHLQCSKLYDEGKLSIDEIIKKDPEPAITKLLNLACKSVWLSSNLSPEFYHRQTVKEAIISSLDRVKDFRLLLDPSVDWVARKKNIPWIVPFVEKGQIKVRKSIQPIPHWLLIDGTHFRLEKEHKGDLSETNNLILYNVATQKNFDPAKLLTTSVLSQFELWWTNGVGVK